MKAASALAETVEAPFLDLTVAHHELRPRLVAAFERVLDSGRYMSGEEVARFEAGLAAYIGADHAVAVASGTAALHLALLAAGVGRGDEVILPPNTFFATAEAVIAAGATPVFADVDPDTALIDPAAVESAIGARTAAVIAVHLYGQPANVDRLSHIAETHGLFLLEDAAQALGASWAGRPVGVLGHAAALSFYPTKNLGGLGEGGGVTTNDRALAQRVSMLRNHGEAAKNVHEVVGFNERLDELRAALLAVKLEQVDRCIDDRRRSVGRYVRLLSEIEGVRAMATAPEARPAPHLMVVRVDRRDDALAALRARGIPAAVHYPTPIHLQPAFRALGLRPGSMPNAERLARSVLSLPLYPGMRDEQVTAAVDALAGAVVQS
jgi:dTDP-4-amino-4,6-dideoxygalactose transaminase